MGRSPCGQRDRAKLPPNCESRSAGQCEQGCRHPSTAGCRHHSRVRGRANPRCPLHASSESDDAQRAAARLGRCWQTTRVENEGGHMAAVAQDTQSTLAGISAGEVDVLTEAVGVRETLQEGTGLDARTFALVKIAALVALDAPPASYAWQVTNALAEGATPEDILGVLRAVAPQVGGPRVVAAAPEIMIALGLNLPEGAE